MSAVVPSTGGDVAADQLGRTLGHEHAFSVHEGVATQFPHLVDREAALRTAIERIGELRRFGVETICDPAVLDLGRDVRFNVAVTEGTGIRFVMATGVYGGAAVSSLPLYFRTRPVDALADAFVHDLTQGIQGTAIRAAFIKVACDAAGLTPDVEKAHRAAARASLRTGAPVMVHSAPAHRSGLSSLAVLEAEGLDPRKVQIAHSGDTEDLDYLRALLERGCFLGMDRYGLEDFLPTAARNDVVVALHRSGWGGRLIAGQDRSAVLHDHRPPEEVARRWPHWRLTYLFEEVFPQLEAAGLRPAELDAMVGDNVAAWLSA